MKIDIAYTIERETGNEDEPIKKIELDVEGSFYQGQLEDFSTYPKVDLTEIEIAEIEEILMQAEFDDYDDSIHDED